MGNQRDVFDSLEQINLKYRQGSTAAEVSSVRFSRVLLINPEHNVEWPGLTPPIGMGYLAESLRNEDIDFAILDMNLSRGLKHLHRALDRFQPDLVGMTMITRDYRRFYTTLEEIRRYNSRIKIVVGGPHVTILKEKVLEECCAIDYGVAGDGERALVELCKGGPGEEEIKGLIYRNNSRIVCTAEREPVTDLDKVPWPRFEKFELNRYFREISLYTSRGCPYRCIFCARHVLSPKYNVRSAGNVGDELEYWYQKGYRKFNIEDDNFNLVEEPSLLVLGSRCSDDWVYSVHDFSLVPSFWRLKNALYNTWSCSGYSPG